MSLGKAFGGFLLSLLRRKVGINVELPLPTGYVAPQPPEGVEESRDLEHCHAELQTRIKAVRNEFELKSSHQLIFTCTWRSCKRQNQLFKQPEEGKPWATDIDGITQKGMHNVFPARAVDVCVDLDPGPKVKISWEETDYDVLGEICARHGLEWGGNWKKKDRPHIQLPNEVI